MVRRRRHRAVPLLLTVVLIGTAACSDDDTMAGEPSSTPAPTAVATTTGAAATTGPAATTLPTTTGPTATTLPATTVGTASPPAPAFPGAAWDPIDATAAGMDPAALAALAADAAAAGSTCTAVVRGGRLVDEQSWGAALDEPREAWSVTKSVTSTLVGIAQDEGFLSIDDAVSAYVPEWLGTPSEAVTIRDILSNDSGRHWDTNTDYVEMAFRADDKTAFAIGLGQEAPPGEVWAYNNSAIQVLDAVLEAATGEQPAAYAERVLFGPLGMTNSRLTTDRAGNTQMYAGLQTTCRDLARFGHMALHDGMWDGRQIVSAGYLQEATGTSSTELNAAYGWLWWLNHPGPIGSALLATRGPGDGSIADGQIAAGQPDDVFWALGLFDQIVAVLPGDDVVAVRMGAEPPADAPFAAPELTRGVAAAVVGD